MRPDFSFTIRELPDLRVVTFRGELDVASAHGLAEALIALAGSTVVIDLTDLAFMDSSGIAALVKARNRITDESHRLVLTRPADNVRKVLEIVGLLDWVEEWSPAWSA